MSDKKTIALIAVAILTMAVGQTIAAPIASDDFETYAAGTPLAGKDGGAGWGGAWNANALATVASGGLSYSSGDVTIDGGSRSVLLAYDSDENIIDGLLYRALPDSQTGTVYMSLLFRDNVNGDLGDDFVQWGFDTGTSNPRTSVMRRNGTFQARATTSSSNSNNSGISTVVGTTFLLVFKAEKSGSTYTPISLFVNPTSDLEPGSPDAAATANSGLASMDYFVSRSAFHESGDAYQIDAIRIGTAFEDVVPEPSSLALLGLAGLALIRRRKA